MLHPRVLRMQMIGYLFEKKYVLIFKCKICTTGM